MFDIDIMRDREFDTSKVDGVKVFCWERGASLLLRNQGL